jgi:hypothetical protein
MYSALVRRDGCHTLIEDIDVIKRQFAFASISTFLVDRHVIVAVHLTVSIAVLQL